MFTIESENASHVLVRFSCIYADEIQLEGFYVFTLKDFREYVEIVHEAKFPQSISIGSNQQLKFESANDYLNSLSVAAMISESQFDSFIQMFRRMYCGHWIEIDLD